VVVLFGMGILMRAILLDGSRGHGHRLSCRLAEQPRERKDRLIDGTELGDICAPLPCHALHVAKRHPNEKNTPETEEGGFDSFQRYIRDLALR
jgi:hypothetical protein